MNIKQGWRIFFSWVLVFTVMWAPGVAQAVSEGRDVGQKMPDFTLSDQTGKDVTFYSKSRGKKTLVYYFMGCCNHCVALLPALAELGRDVEKNGVAVVGIQYYGNTEFCKFTMGKHQIVGTVFADSKGEICGRMGVGEFMTMTLDEQGLIRYRGPNVDHVDQIKKSLGVL